GGLLSVALLHHYSGFTQVLPVTLLWLLLRKRSLHRLPTFVAKNPILLGVGAIFLITVVIHPELFTRRLADVTMGVGHGAAAPFFSHDFIPKLRKNWAYLESNYWRDYPRQLFRQNGGSWPFLSIPPLGGWIGPLVVGMWVVSCCVMRGRRMR